MSFRPLHAYPSLISAAFVLVLLLSTLPLVADSGSFQRTGATGALAAPISGPASFPPILHSSKSRGEATEPAPSASGSTIKAPNGCGRSLVERKTCAGSLVRPSPAGINTSNWLNLTTNGSAVAPQVLDAGFAYDPLDGYDLLFGGMAKSSSSNATWTFQNGTWTRLQLTLSPPAGFLETMAWDPVDDYAILFGGTDGSVDYNQTWSFRGGHWAELHPTVSPPARSYAAMAWDATDGYVVLFGGLGALGTDLNDTWTFLHGNWTEVNESVAPSPRKLPGFASDPTDLGVVLFGGWQDQPVNYLNDTWLFHNGGWTEQHPLDRPSARTVAYMAFDPKLGEVLLFGGGNGTSSYFGDTWTFAQGQWTLVTTNSTPGARCCGEMAPDPLEGGLVLAGGCSGGVLCPSIHNDTWVFYTLQLNVTANPQSWEGPANVSFNASVDYGARPYTYNFSFGDGTFSTLVGPQHLYPSPGTYAVQVTATDAQNVSVSKELTATEFSPLAAVGTATPLSGTAPLTVSVSADATSGKGPYRYAWSAPTVVGLSSSNGSLIFPVPGTYTLALTVNDALGYEVVRTFNVTVDSAPAFAVGIIPSASSGSAPLEVQLFSFLSGGTGPFTYTWSLGNGQTAVTPFASVTFTSPGNYSVSLGVVDALGVRGTATANVSVTPGLTVAADWSVNASVAPLAAHFTALASGGTEPYLYLWTFGDGGTGTLLDPVHTYPAAGNYTASVEVVDAVGHQVTQTVNVSLTKEPTPLPAPSSPGISISTELTVVAIVLTATALGASVVLLAAAVTAWRGRRRPR